MPGYGSGRARFYHRYPAHIDPAKGFSVTEKDPSVDRTLQAIILYRVDSMGYFGFLRKELQVKERGQVNKSEAASTDARFEDGPTRISVEAAVIAVEQRGRVIPVDARVNSLWRMST